MRRALICTLILTSLLAGQTLQSIVVNAATSTFGYPTVGSGNDGADRIVGSVFVCSEDGVASGISVAVRSSYGSFLRLKCAVYRQSDLGLVGVTQEVSVPAWYSGWQTLSFGSPQPPLIAGANYILVALSENIGGNFLAVYYDPGSVNQGVVQRELIYADYPGVLSPTWSSLKYSIYCSYTTDSATQNLPTDPTPVLGGFGYQTIGNGDGGADRIVGSVFVCSQAGTASSITVAVRSSSGVASGLKGAIYRESDLALVAVTDEVSVPAWFEGWQTLSFGSPQPLLTAGANYVLMAFSGISNGNFLAIHYDAGSANQGYVQGNVAYPNFPPVLSPSLVTLKFSIWCNTIASSDSTTPPTPTPPLQQQASIEIYSNQACTTALTSITWGTITPGSSSTLTLYVWNRGNTPVTLTKSVTDWNPTSLSNYLTLNWDYASQTVPANGTQKVTLTLNVPANTPTAGSFSFNTIITATG